MCSENLESDAILVTLKTLLEGIQRCEQNREDQFKDWEKTCLALGDK